MVYRISLGSLSASDVSLVTVQFVWKLISSPGRCFGISLQKNVGWPFHSLRNVAMQRNPTGGCHLDRPLLFLPRIRWYVCLLKSTRLPLFTNIILGPTPDDVGWWLRNARPRPQHELGTVIYCLTLSVDDASHYLTRDAPCHDNNVRLDASPQCLGDIHLGQVPIPRNSSSPTMLSNGKPLKSSLKSSSSSPHVLRSFTSAPNQLPLPPTFSRTSTLQSLMTVSIPFASTTDPESRLAYLDLLMKRLNLKPR